MAADPFWQHHSQGAGLTLLCWDRDLSRCTASPCHSTCTLGSSGSASSENNLSVQGEAPEA